MAAISAVGRRINNHTQPYFFPTFSHYIFVNGGDLEDAAVRVLEEGLRVPVATVLANGAGKVEMQAFPRAEYCGCG